MCARGPARWRSRIRPGRVFQCAPRYARCARCYTKLHSSTAACAAGGAGIGPPPISRKAPSLRERESPLHRQCVSAPANPPPRAYQHKHSITVDLVRYNSRNSRPGGVAASSAGVLLVCVCVCACGVAGPGISEDRKGVKGLVGRVCLREEWKPRAMIGVFLSCLAGAPAHRIPGC